MVFNSPKAVGMHLSPNLIPVAIKKKVIILNYC